MRAPIMNERLALRIQQSEIDYITSRVSSIGEQAGNPQGVEIKRYGGATALYVSEMPWRTFNTVVGLTRDNSNMLEDIIAFYREKQRSFDIPVNPCNGHPELLKCMAQLGLYQEDFHSVLYGVPIRELPPLPDEIRIEEVADEDGFDRYAEIHCVGSGMSVMYKKDFAANNIGLLHRPGWKIFLAYWQNTPAAVAVMHIANGIWSESACNWLGQEPFGRRSHDLRIVI